MKSLTLSLLTLFFYTALSGQVIDREFPDSKGRIKLLGEASYDRLTKAPFKEWFTKNEETYEPDENDIAELKTALNSVDSISIFMGTWCGDSKREVPRFTKMLKEANYDFNKLSIICVDNTWNNYKQSPENQQADANIHRVPTFIFHSNQEEVGRIVERPVASLEKDLIAVAEGNYKPSYSAVQFLHNYLEENGVASLTENETEVVEQLRLQVKAWNELTTYGKMLLTSWKIKEAVRVLEINSKMFPEEEYAQLHLANAYYLTGDYEKTELCCREALAINPDSEFAQTLMARLK
ncbi:MAG: hypothetical protein WBA74_25085 [Cyclobacteriaceae bacterium]